MARPFFVSIGWQIMISSVSRVAKAIVLACLVGGLALHAGSAWAGSTRTFWHEIAARDLAAGAPRPSAYRILSLDVEQVRQYLQEAHARGIAAAIELPQPDGGFAQFIVVDSGTMPAELQARYPSILSLKGSDAQGRALRLDVSVLGLQAMVFSPDGSWVVRPETLGNTSRYLSFRRADLALPDDAGRCEVKRDSADDHALDLAAQPMTQTGVVRRVYRAAVAANHQYIAAVGGGTVEGGLAATIVAINRVTQIYEYEMSIQLVLVPNNDRLMYANAANDPFAGNDGNVINNSTSIISVAIGASNYDIGHVFTTGSGGLAGLGVVCRPTMKGEGTTGLSNPIGDTFYVDYVAHEMGHQFGGDHPFNGTISNCSGGNRNGSTAYEPGSGSTIMGYAGICGADDLQSHSDPYFHAISLQQITNYTNSASGNCSVNASNDNLPPVIDTANLPNGYTIPARTPFMLAATASDPDAGDAVRYAWEEWDRGAAAPLSAGDNGSSPIFRAFPPSYSGTRVFPSLSTILTGVAVKGETLPTTTRTLKFRLTARDLHQAHGSSSSADISLNVTNGAGPFRVSAPNTAVSWPQNSAQTVNWDVANTQAAPINCSQVDIALSADGGYTFPYSLAAGVANSGTANISVPAITTSRARIAVSCANNIFFDISDADFTIPAASGSYTIGGSVSGLSGSGLVVALNGSAMTLAADGNYAFPGALATGMAYAVAIETQPTQPAQTCSVSNASGQVATANVGNVDIHCTTVPVASYPVGGTISGLLGAGLSLQINGGAPTAFSVNGAYAFPPLADGSPYHVRIVAQPGNPAQTCALVNGQGTIDGAAVTNINVTCVTNTYTIGGMVSGASGAGLALKLNGGADFAIAGNGAYTFPTALADGTAYTVTVSTSPAGQTCTVANGSGTVSGFNVINVGVSCVTNTYSIGGDVSGLLGSGLVLSLNAGAQTLPIAADGHFTFPTALASGAGYVVSVTTQPTAPIQTCTVTNGSGTVSGGNVTNVVVSCTDRIFFDGFDGN